MKMTKAVKEKVKVSTSQKVTNFMNGVSYKSLNPVTRLKLIATSSIFGEPSYYRNGSFGEAQIKDAICGKGKIFLNSGLDVFEDIAPGAKTTEIMEETIDKALSYDFLETLKFAVELRTTYNMRLNPQVIMVRAAKHPSRIEFTKKYPGLFNEINQKVMSRPDEPASQLTYTLYLSHEVGKNTKKNIPNILKKSWANKLESLTSYQVAKYKNSHIGMIDTVRICHANSLVLDELMTTGQVNVDDDDKTWENLRSEGKTWHEILKTIKLGHMALLRNLNNIFKENWTYEEAKEILETLVKGVKNGKQFPFRYWVAMKNINRDSNHIALIKDALEECIDVACDNMPKLKGKTVALSDNSGSAWGTIPSEYGSVKVAEIDNLSALIAARNSDEGEVGLFGDTLKMYPISKRNGLLKQLNDFDIMVGGCTENGIWLFFKDAIDNKKFVDNIFIFSDQQAGHGGLYGTYSQIEIYREKYGCNSCDKYVDVLKLVEEYRKTVNPKVNVFSVQTAGYNNTVLPEYAYRCNLLSGWTGKEVIFADAVIRQWNEVDKSFDSQDKSSQ